MQEAGRGLAALQPPQHPSVSHPPPSLMSKHIDFRLNFLIHSSSLSYLQQSDKTAFLSAPVATSFILIVTFPNPDSLPFFFLLFYWHQFLFTFPAYSLSFVIFSFTPPMFYAHFSFLLFVSHLTCCHMWIRPVSNSLLMTVEGNKAASQCSMGVGRVLWGALQALYILNKRALSLANYSSHAGVTIKRRYQNKSLFGCLKRVLELIPTWLEESICMFHCCLS